MSWGNETSTQDSSFPCCYPTPLLHGLRGCHGRPRLSVLPSHCLDDLACIAQPGVAQNSGPSKWPQLLAVRSANALRAVERSASAVLPNGGKPTQQRCRTVQQEDDGGPAADLEPYDAEGNEEKPHHVTPTMLLVMELGLTLASGDAFCAH